MTEPSVEASLRSPTGDKDDLDNGWQRNSHHATYYTLIAEKLTLAHETRTILLTLDSLNTSESPEAIISVLRKCRLATDTLEGIMTDLLLIKTRAEQLKSRAIAAVEDAEIETMKTYKPSDFSGARERGIDINARTLAERRTLRKATDLAQEAAMAVDIVRTMHRGADGHRTDLNLRLRALTLTTTLER